MITLQKANRQDIKIIQDIAYKTWPSTYQNIISKAQIAFMLDAFYNDKTLTDNILNKNHHFVLAYEGEQCLGFGSYEFDYQNTQKTRIHKLYLLPNCQGKGIGQELLTYITNEALQQHNIGLHLNVNKYNQAVLFYKKQGFEITKEYDLEIGQGYLMEDYIMEKKI
ncbi:GNAT family N-acetyltransferase [Flavobacterium branchiophilum]|uniref:Probable acetyltransferase, GNAT family n=1 Tax=Flavobacterium branchiophilum (strain FL-15) TaxID=1034807 RepID=G2Z2C7_FLABF|nr:GNAT family N-acetyltransferase [Flavobacterium branchiophilum]CCB70085.1 Probable acetyltransferase, GNAT family [Flavobacterium branchiophilum FL-15]